MEKTVLLSLCIPTNGIAEWVFPVLNSIYNQAKDLDKFEVVVTDNGSDEEFGQMLETYALEHENLVYKKNNSYLFNNQLEALKIAKGDYLKFINHRTILLDGSLEKLLNFIEQNRDQKAVIYFSNGLLNIHDEVMIYPDFNSFVKGLGHYASLTTGVGIWKEDFNRIPSDFKYSNISPHSGVLFSERKKSKYIINNQVLLKDIDPDQSKKGKYDLFCAFGYEELSITMDLLCDGDITVDTFKTVKKGYKKFLCNLYLDLVLFKDPCSYELGGFNKAMGIYFNKYSIILGAILRIPKRIIRNIKNRLREKYA